MPGRRSSGDLSNSSRFGSLRSRATVAGISEPRVLVGLILLALAIGGVLQLFAPDAGDLVWAAAIALALVPLTWSVVRSLAHGDVGVDAIALVAMAGALALGEYLAGAVVALMLSGGNALEAAAGRRARRELTALLERAPRVAHRRRGEALEEVAVEDLEVADRIVVRAGEVVPVDGAVQSDAVLDESTLTGESLPVLRGRGTPVASGTVNAGDAFDMRATRTSSESAYAGIVKLVREAEHQRAPFVRMADRYAALLLPVTLAVSGLAWALSGDPVRALAVLVVATPCPLILAAPVALISGVSRAARRGIIVKGGATIEKLGSVRSVLLDKTGTLTHGRPGIEEVRSANGLAPEALLKLAASVDQLSAHVLAEALVHGAEARGIELLFPEQVVEDPGQGIEGRVDGRRVAVGSADWLRRRGYSAAGAASLIDEELQPGWARILVGVDGSLAGAVLMADRVREDAAELTGALRAAGIVRIGLVTGDQQAVGEAVGNRVGVDRVYSECSPADKIDVVREARDRGTVAMVGDGVNDAPALALADVGIAMGGAGATVSSEAADAVIAVDRIDRVADAVRIGRRSLSIARQSVLVGLGLSFIAMGLAARGHIPPVAGALLQEGIDVAVILNALRALRG